MDGNETGNFLIRLGYITGALKDPRVVSFLRQKGAAHADVEAAYEALMRLANCFYQIKG